MTQSYYWFSQSDKDFYAEQCRRGKANSDRAGRPGYLNFDEPTGSYAAIYVGPEVAVSVGGKAKSFKPGDIIEYTYQSPHPEARPARANPDEVVDVAVLDSRDVAVVRVPAGTPISSYTVGDGGADNKQLRPYQVGIFEQGCTTHKLRLPSIEGRRIGAGSSPLPPPAPT